MGFNYDLVFSLFGIPFLYMLVIYFTSPYKSISLKNSVKSVVLGFVSVTLLHFMYLIFPINEWECLTEFDKWFYVVGFREEFSKFLAFILLIKWTIKEKLHPIAYMYYFGMVSLGFAIEENMVYMQRYGAFVLETRNFTAVLAHIFFGMFAGYWYGLGKLNTGTFSTRSVFGITMKNWPKVKQTFYSFIGIFFASAYHGLWNYNLNNSGSSRDAIMIMMIFFGLITTNLLANNLMKGYRNKINK